MTAYKAVASSLIRIIGGKEGDRCLNVPEAGLTPREKYGIRYNTDESSLKSHISPLAYHGGLCGVVYEQK